MHPHTSSWQQLFLDRAFCDKRLEEYVKNEIQHDFMKPQQSSLLSKFDKIENCMGNNAADTMYLNKYCLKEFEC